jgi:hypothetical protein
MQLEVGTPGSGGSTPRDKLFSEDADMSSVFKSRPKIAMSPMLSPERSIMEEDTILASHASGLQLEEDDNGN